MNQSYIVYCDRSTSKKSLIDPINYGIRCAIELIGAWRRTTNAESLRLSQVLQEVAVDSVVGEEHAGVAEA